MKRIIVWLRNNLRIHDHEALTRAMRDADEVIPLYIFDPRMWEPATLGLGWSKMGPRRTQFLLESVIDLRHHLISKGAQLCVRVGHPEDIIPELAAEWGVQVVYANKEVTSEELKIEEALCDRIPVNFYWDHTLYHHADLDMPIKHLPETFTTFRKHIEKYIRPRVAQPAPDKIAFPRSNVEPGTIPTMEHLGQPALPADTRNAFPFEGGERAALQRLQHFIWDSTGLKCYKETRNGLIGTDYSSKFSPWLAIGAISPRAIRDEVLRYEAEHKATENTYWLIFELIWRDFFRFMALKHQNRIFQLQGLQAKETPPTAVDERFDAWRLGQTGQDFVDANMRELLHTGYMSNRGRQNVASYLVHNLKQDWRMGASWFEHQLVDYDVCSNWCNWMYVAGVGNDPRENRVFNPEKQSDMYDPEGTYRNLWSDSVAVL